jgi:long-chain acyl-CoA synthetase
MSGDPLFEALAARQPGDIVLRGRDAHWNVIAVQHAIDDFADRLAGIRVLAVLADNSPQWVIADLAALRAGVAHLPLPAFFSPEQLRHALQATAADAVLTDQAARIAMLDLGFERTGEWNGLAIMRRKVAAVHLPTGTAKVSFTSGSTGAPKGVCLSAAGLMATAQALTRRLADIPVARHLAVLPLALLLENVAGIYAPLLRGATVHLPALQDIGWRGMTGFDPAALHSAATQHQAHSLILVPELLKGWTQYLQLTHQKAPVGLNYVAVGGARVDPELLARGRQLGLPVYQGYGLTECGSVVSLNRPGDDGQGVGRLLDHARLRIEADEVRIATQVFLGYLGDAARSGEQEFATGDLGYLDPSGHLHLSGRRKNLLMTSYGRNIAPEWVESVLLAQPEIAQAIVAGESQPWLCGILVPAADSNASAMSSAVARANAALPEYACIGGWITAAPFSIDNGQATGNGRPVRIRILAAHKNALASLYKQEETTDVVL